MIGRIIGVGVMAPGDMGREAYWTLISNGRSATAPISLFDARSFRSSVGAECDFDPYAAGLTSEHLAGADRASQLAVAAALEAVSDAALDLSARRVGVVVGSAVGCTMALEKEYVAVSDAGSRWLVDPATASPRLHDHLVPSSIARDVAWAIGAEGPCYVVSNGCTSGLDVVRHALRLLRTTTVDAVVAVGADAPISPITVACFDAIRATTASTDNPATASRPFDLGRDGFVLGEGAAAVVITRPRQSRRDGYADIVGAQSRANAYHMTGLRVDGTEMSVAIRSSIAEGGLGVEDIDYVNAHGSGTKQNDRHETAAVKSALGGRAYEVGMSSFKSMVGHSLGAIGTLEIAGTVLSISRGFVPPTANYSTPDPDCDLDYVPNVGRSQRIRAAVSVGSGFGGFQSAVALTEPGYESCA